MNGPEPDSVAGDFGQPDIWADSRQRLQGIGVKSGAALDLSSLNWLPNPFLASNLEIRRGRQRRFTAFSPPETVSAGVPASSLSTAEYPHFAGSGRLDPQLIVREMIRALGAVTRSAPTAQRGFSSVYEGILGEPNQKTGEVSTAELLKILALGAATVFDARTELEYAIGHIPGALCVGPKPGTPMSRYVSDAAEVARVVPDRNSPIVTYCNGQFCGKSRRLGEDLVNAGFTKVRRYQLGTPVWRALVGPMEIEPEGIRYIQRNDQTAAFIDARSPEEFASGSLPGARNIPVDAIVAAKDDGRLPMDDFNTRVVVFGRDGMQALGLAIALVGNGFNNVKLCSCGFFSLATLLR
jgi:rhodanese-related sulfurtransferase